MENYITRQIPNIDTSKLIVSDYLPLIERNGLAIYLLLVYSTTEKRINKSTIMKYLHINQTEFDECQQIMEWCELISVGHTHFDILEPKPITEDRLHRIRNNVTKPVGSFYEASPNYQKLRDQMLQRINVWCGLETLLRRG